jgi:hypothetical protein
LHYHSITLEWRLPAPTKALKIQSLLHSLLSKPAYLGWVKNLEFVATACLDYSVNDVCGIYFPGSSGIVVGREEEESEMLKAWVEQMDAYAYCVYTTGENALYVVIALVIAMCGGAALEELTVSIDFLLHNEWFSTMLRYGLKAELWGTLKKVRVTTEWKEEAELWGPDYVHVRSKLLILFFNPAIESLEIGALADARWEEGQLAWLHREEDVDEEFWPVWSLDRRPVAGHLTTLRLVRSSIHPKTIERLLMQTLHVTVFEYDCFANVDHRPVDLDV